MFQPLKIKTVMIKLQWKVHDRWSSYKRNLIQLRQIFELTVNLNSRFLSLFMYMCSLQLDKNVYTDNTTRNFFYLLSTNNSKKRFIYLIKIEFTFSLKKMWWRSFCLLNSTIFWIHSLVIFVEYELVRRRKDICCRIYSSYLIISWCFFFLLYGCSILLGFI